MPVFLGKVASDEYGFKLCYIRERERMGRESLLNEIMGDWGIMLPYEICPPGYGLIGGGGGVWVASKSVHQKRVIIGASRLRRPLTIWLLFCKSSKVWIPTSG